jgi:hypothetical protein
MVNGHRQASLDVWRFTDTLPVLEWRLEPRAELPPGASGKFSSWRRDVVGIFTHARLTDSGEAAVRSWAV